MTEANELHVVIGASGGTGSAIVRELVARGKRVRGVNRSGHADVPSVVEMLKADATDPSSMREVCQGATVVYNCVNPPFAQWTQIFPAVMEATIEGAAAADAKLVFADDTWMYGKVDRPMTEDLPSRPVSNKGVLRAWLAEMLLSAHSRGKVRAVIGRGGELYGPLVESVLGQNLFGAALAGKKGKEFMNSTSSQDLVRGSWLRFGLLLLAAVPLSVGFWAFLAPYHFYDIFPLPGRHWISTLGSYNEHLVRDYGANNLGFGVLLAAAAISLERHLTQVALVSWLAFALPHFIFHLTQTHHFQLFDNLTQLGSLGFVVLLPIILLFFVTTHKE